MRYVDTTVSINAVQGFEDQCIIRISLNKRLFLHENNLCKNVLLSALDEALNGITEQMLESIDYTVEPYASV